MRGLAITLALALLAGAGWAALEARESEADARDRITACVADARAVWRRDTAIARLDAPFFPPSHCTVFERRWQPERLILAAVLGVGGVLALVGAMAVRPAAPLPRIAHLPPAPAPIQPATRAPAPPEPIDGDSPLAERARALQRAAAARGFALSAEAALRSAQTALAREAAERGEGTGHG